MSQQWINWSKGTSWLNKEMNCNLYYYLQYTHYTAQFWFVLIAQCWKASTGKKLLALIKEERELWSYWYVWEQIWISTLVVPTMPQTLGKRIDILYMFLVVWSTIVIRNVQQSESLSTCFPLAIHLKTWLRSYICI